MNRFSALSDRHDRPTILLHWLTALLVVGLWGIAQVINVPDPGAGRVILRSIHIVLGVVLAAVLVARLAWRVRHRYAVTPAETGLLALAAKAVHILLYGLLMALVVLGIANVWVRGDSIFGLFQVPAFDPGNRDLRHQVGGLHGLAANLIMITAAVHAAAALFHHHVLRDRVLLRMLPQRSS